MIRPVTDTIYRATGDPWVGAQVQFRLLSGSYAPDGTHPPDRVTATAGADGTLTVDLWCNADGEVATLWECRLPGGDSFTFLLDYGDGTPIDLPSLRRGSITPTDPEYPTLLSYIDEHGIVPAQAAAQDATDAAGEARASLSVAVADLAGSRDLAPGDADSLLRYAGAGAATLTIPAGLDWSVGRAVGVVQIGAGAVTVAAGVGVTLEGWARSTRAQGSVLSVLLTGADRWLIAGDGLP